MKSVKSRVARAIVIAAPAIFFQPRHKQLPLEASANLLRETVSSNLKTVGATYQVARVLGIVFVGGPPDRPC